MEANNTTKLKRYAQFARKFLKEQVTNKLNFVIKDDSLARRESGRAVTKLEEEIDRLGEEAIIEKVAYLWFNRICAFRFMDVNNYNKVRVVSALPGNFQPESFSEAKNGFIEDGVLDDKKKQRFQNLLNGSISSTDAQQEAYRLLLIGYCNHFYSTMPYLFERVEDYTELLLPDDLLSGSSIIAYTCETLTPVVCEDVEVIGWLYQYYISEKKDEVFEGLKKKKKITPEDIPAATQLFTPNWIVRYLVENSLGRLWMLNRPNSNLINSMDYYIKPEQEDTDFLKISSPEELKICDPACGSGHMLVYAFDLLYSIYEEEGYQLIEIPGLILKNNLYGIDIDERAGELAAFALTMKARGKYKRFLKKPIQPNICVLERVEINDDDLKSYTNELGRDLLTSPFIQTIEQFKNVNNFGSLLKPIETNSKGILQILKQKGLNSNLLQADTHNKILKIIKMIDYLSPKYHVVVANPPYMGGKGMNVELSDYAKKEFPDSKRDLFAMFIERNLELVVIKGLIGMITMQSWMFLSSYEKLRVNLLNSKTILSMAHLGARGFDSISGEVVQTTAFVIENEYKKDYKGDYLRLVDGKSEAEKQKDFKENRFGGNLRFSSGSTGYQIIPDTPIVYWKSHFFMESFKNSKLLIDIAVPRAGLATGDNTIFQRNWCEVDFKNIAFDCKTNIESRTRREKWYPCNSGGEFRKWFGNNFIIVNWQHDGNKIRDFRNDEGKLKSRPQNTGYFFKEGVTWTKLSTNTFAARLRESGYIFDDTGRSAFPDIESNIFPLLGLMCSSFANTILKVLNPSMSFTSGDLAKLPVSDKILSNENLNVKYIVEISKKDWNSYETSWDFTTLPILGYREGGVCFGDSYGLLRGDWSSSVTEMKELEETNNDIFIKAYGLESELDCTVPLKEITLTCNPHYRYGGDKSSEQLEGSLLLDTVKEFISYSVGCMFGRYSLDSPGLILANQGETIEDYLGKVSDSFFMPDSDNVIPIMAVDWFEDDIAVRFSEFLKVTFGEENFEENIRFIEEALGYKTSGKSKSLSIRNYFLKNYYKDHVKTYKKRPIYWMFSSPKGTFNVLIYMHRYTTETLDIILNDYLRDFSKKLSAHKENRERGIIELTGAVKHKAEKEIKELEKQIKEIDNYEREFYEFVSKGSHKIDLDDGVKVNYPKFGDLLNKVVGLSKSGVK